MGWQDAPLVRAEPTKLAWQDALEVGAEYESDAAPDIRKRAPKEDAEELRHKETYAKRIAGLGEAALEAGTGTAASAIGGLAGLGQTAYRKLWEGKPLEEATKEGAETIRATQEAMTYQPRLESGKLASKVLSAPIEMGGEYAGKGLGAIGKVVGGEKGRIAGESIGEAAVPMAAAALGGRAAYKGAPKTLIPKKDTAPAMVGIGDAETEAAALRRARAAGHDVPIELTKGEAERTYAQKKFEEETAKAQEGEPLRQRKVETGEKILQNFDVWAESTGAEASGLRAVGEKVDKALLGKVKAAKGKVKSAYDEAKAAGHMAEPVSYKALTDYLDTQTPTTKTQLAPILKAVEEQIAKNDPKGTGQMPINQIEDIRKLINKNVQAGTPSEVHGVELKKMIDAATENAGGDLYKEARKLHADYAREFKNQGTISKLLRNKPGTTDRAVAFEDVFDHAILKGSMDDVASVRKTLTTAGEDGAQAWKELQGQTLNHLKERITKNISRDIKGNPIVSPAEMNKLVTELDKDGKLDLILGKQMAQKVRDINETIKDVYTAPPGTINTSNTASALVAAMDKLEGKFGGAPLGVGGAVSWAAKQVKSRETGKRVREALGQDDKSKIKAVPPLPMSAAGNP